MNDEIKEIERILATSGKYITYAERCYVLDYITNLQQAVKDTKDTADDMLFELQQENERLNNCIDDQERVINSLIDKRDLYKINYNDYKSRCEKAVEYINENKHLSMFADCREPEEDWNYDLECSANDLLNILQNGSDSQ